VAAKRELIEPKPGDEWYVRRDRAGLFTSEQGDVGRSLAVDRRRRATEAKPGYGDRGDRPTRQGPKRLGRRTTTR
jgi:hypothetical protein